MWLWHILVITSHFPSISAVCASMEAEANTDLPSVREYNIWHICILYSPNYFLLVWVQYTLFWKTYLKPCGGGLEPFDVWVAQHRVRGDCAEHLQNFVESLREGLQLPKAIRPDLLLWRGTFRLVLGFLKVPLVLLGNTAWYWVINI